MIPFDTQNALERPFSSQETTSLIVCEACGLKFPTLTLNGTPFSDYRQRFCDPCVEFMRDEYLRPFRPSASNPIPEEFRDYDQSRLKHPAFIKLSRGINNGFPTRLMLTGATGAGKSYFAVGVAKRYSADTKRCRWTTGSAIKATLKPTDHEEQRERNELLIRQCKRSLWLCIDDLGHGNWTTPYAELILEIINARHTLQTVITSQFPPSQWKQHINGDCSHLTIDAITRRLEDYYAIWAI